ncbi:MAG: glutamate--tRNA ligase family protein [bacterium]|jgi:nondiscriminating glutamyl-tRNA synthetase|nr:glutamate--tRNA ligase family protein [candidate division KSB1 bacterium]MDH7560089.1 glutamate--tRNA ligase family protein [bacterium]
MRVAKQQAVNMPVSPRVVFSVADAGHLSLAEARLALVSWLLAKKGGGTFVVRLDDFAGGLQPATQLSLYRDLQWLGMAADEGPGIGGDFAPYRQAERHELYARFLEKLLAEQSAFRCFCVGDGARSPQPAPAQCSAGCSTLPARRVEELSRQGVSSIVRLKGQAGEIVVDDLLRGPISLRGEAVGDVVLAMPSGAPTPEFRAAVDDALMFASHVVRDEQAMPFTFRQVLICRALDLEPPQVAHLASVRALPGFDPAAEHRRVTIERLRREGYLASTVLAFVARLVGMEIAQLTVRSAAELLPLFRLQELPTHEAVLNLEVLREESRRQLRPLSDEELHEALRPALARAGLGSDPRLPQLVALYRDWAFSVGDLAQKLSVFGRESVPVMDRTAVQFLARESSQKVLWSFARGLRSLRHLDAEVFSRLMTKVRQETGLMGHDLWVPVRLVLTGDRDGPPLPQVVALMGRDKCQKLIERILG